MKVLVADDDEAVRKLLRIQLSAGGHQITDVADGVEALSALKSYRFDAVISDILMPRMDGYRLCYEIRRSESLRHLPIVIYSSTYTSPAEEEVALGVGASRFVRKPARGEDLLRILEEVATSREDRPSPRPPAQDLHVLKQYSERLVQRLEERNLALESARERLAASTSILEESERLHREAVERAPIGVLQISAAGEILFANREAARILGFASKDALVGVSFEDAATVGPEERAAVAGALRRTGRISARAASLKNRKGKVLEVLADVHGVAGADRRIVRYEVFLRELAGRREARDAAPAGEVRYRALIEAAEDAILVLGADGAIVAANRAAEHLHGRSREELVGSPYLGLLPAEEREAMRRRVEDALRNGHAPAEVAPAARPDGRVLPVEASVSAAQIGAERLAIVIAREVPERSSLAEHLRLAQKFDAVARLAGGVAHDFNNLLTAIVGYAEILADGLAGDPARLEDVEEIRRAGRRATMLTRELLVFSGRVATERVDLDLNAVVRRSEPRMRELAGERVELATKLGPEVGAVRGVAAEIEQVLFHLAVNARDAMPEGGRLTIETSNVELETHPALELFSVQQGPFVRLSVSDDGVGLDGVTRSRVFEPFLAAKGKGRGTGLALAAVYGIVRRHGGQVVVASERSRGTTFEVYLPRVGSQAAAEQESEGYRPPTEASARRAR